ncbi:hypothetical protein BDS110ZK4_15290 [Bradyrhizobium diazoefficiens]|uniref:Uncharacterized protein n=1 Tax=Bradyrhizobium diazoefficiens TaxID=1355477 RepID=A0A810D256_9BRAD|nr:hypothetical protein XF1B_69800 [Bradyrhizobium diazoefficiens]BCE50556.1 hypothetical protein XF4B_69050 [Bradyrhizobium diazoefficiens]BCE94059.1 hypothetical protein XF10B_68570 [Bradyrhizobium diazoefficiens]BCF29000.1 hypothetical protein XF14B_69520 [Bradyrhizobium diazoefficiens]
MGVKVFAAGLTPAMRFSCSCVPRTRRHATNVRYRVELRRIERTELRVLLSGGKHASRKLKHARILLAADGGASDEADGVGSRLDAVETSSRYCAKRIGVIARTIPV